MRTEIHKCALWCLWSVLQRMCVDVSGWRDGARAGERSPSHRLFGAVIRPQRRDVKSQAADSGEVMNESMTGIFQKMKERCKE